MRSNHYYNKPAVTEKPKKGVKLSTEKLASDIAEFLESGGKITVLPAVDWSNMKARIEDSQLYGGSFS